MNALYPATLPWAVSQRSSGHLQGRGRERRSRSHHNRLLPGTYSPKEKEKRQRWSQTK